MRQTLQSAGVGCMVRAMPESVPPPQSPLEDPDFLSRLGAAIRRYRRLDGPCRGELVVDGMRVVLEEQYLGWPPRRGAVAEGH
jgi:hypothetical protein